MGRAGVPRRAPVPEPWSVIGVLSLHAPHAPPHATPHGPHATPHPTPNHPGRCAQVEADFPSLGTALPVIFPRAAAAPASALPYPSVGSWVNLRNVGARVVDGQLQGFVTARSKWAPRRDAQAVLMPALHARVARNAVSGPRACECLLSGWRVGSRDTAPGVG